MGWPSPLAAKGQNQVTVVATPTPSRPSEWRASTVAVSARKPAHPDGARISETHQHEYAWGVAYRRPNWGNQVAGRSSKACMAVCQGSVAGRHIGGRAIGQVSALPAVCVCHVDL